MARASRRLAIAKPRRVFDWVGVAATVPVTVAPGTKVLLASSANTQADTVVRSYLGLLVQSDQIAAAEEGVGAIGVALVSADAFAAGVASLPGPTSDFDFPWWMHGFLPWSIVNGVAYSAFSGELETKSQRKTKPAQTLVLVAENPHGSFGMELVFGWRLLSMLS